MNGQLELPPLDQIWLQNRRNWCSKPCPAQGWHAASQRNLCWLHTPLLNSFGIQYISWPGSPGGKGWSNKQSKVWITYVKTNLHHFGWIKPEKLWEEPLSSPPWGTKSWCRGVGIGSKLSSSAGRDQHFAHLHLSILASNCFHSHFLSDFCIGILCEHWNCGTWTEGETRRNWLFEVHCFLPVRRARPPRLLSQAISVQMGGWLEVAVGIRIPYGSFLWKVFFVDW